MDTFYTVLEVQNNGTPAAIPTIYNDEAAAYAKYYTVLAAAAVSEVAYHACHIIRSDGIMIEGKVFYHSEPELAEEYVYKPEE